MPSQAEIEGADPLSATGAELLTSYLRGSSFYLQWSFNFTDLAGRLTEHVGAETVKSRLLASILEKIEALGDGTVGVKGGKYGADYSQARDRDQLCVLALSTLYDFASLGINIGQQTEFLLGGKRGGEICDEVTLLVPRK